MVDRYLVDLLVEKKRREQRGVKLNKESKQVSMEDFDRLEKQIKQMKTTK